MGFGEARRGQRHGSQPLPQADLPLRLGSARLGLILGDPPSSLLAAALLASQRGGGAHPEGVACRGQSPQLAGWPSTTRRNPSSPSRNWSPHIFSQSTKRPISLPR